MKPLYRVVNTFERFTKNQSFGGIVLVVCTLVALIWANGPFSQTYFDLNALKVGLKIGDFTLFKSASHWVNDGLMAIFFLLVGLEIKRELVAGELSSLSKAILPIIAAVGGIVVPAVVFLLINHQTPAHHPGWAIPVATDIAFAIGIMSLAGRGVPRNLLLLLAAIAIVDDICAVLIIAFCYTKHIVIHDLLICLLCFAMLMVLNLVRFPKLLPYIVIGVVLWYFMLKSGVHATIAGILLAITIPTRTGDYDPNLFSKNIHSLMNLFDKHAKTESAKAIREHRKAILGTANDLIRHEITPLQRLENILHGPVNFFVIPVFVLFNAGVALSAHDLASALTSTLTLGIIAGLVLGKCLGIFGVTAIFAKLNLVKLPSGIKIKHLLPLSLIAGVGFTMSIFIGDLAFVDQTHMTYVKIGILAGSLIAAILGFILLKILCPAKVRA